MKRTLLTMEVKNDDSRNELGTKEQVLQDMIEDLSRIAKALKSYPDSGIAIQKSLEVMEALQKLRINMLRQYTINEVKALENNK